MSRVERRFAALETEGRGGLVVFVTCGDPDPETFFEILSGLPEAGVDVIEIGMQFFPMSNASIFEGSQF